MDLTENEKKRYARHLVLPEVGLQGQLKLKAAKVLVIGAGGLGCPVLKYLCAAGVGTIGVVDNDQVDVSNLQRQILFDEEDIGKSKVQCAKRKLQNQNPEVVVIPIQDQFTSSNALKIANDYDLIIDGSDNFPTRYLSNDVSVMQNKPLVFGSIYRFEGQVSVFNYRNGPTYRCLYPEPPAQAPDCSEAGVLGVLPGIVGTLMAAETIKVILGREDVLSGKLLILDVKSMAFQTLSFKEVAGNKKINKLIDYELFCKSKTNHIMKEISVSELKKMLDNGEAFQLIDVREESEYRERNINGINIPLGRVEAEHDKISKTGKVVVHCKMGGRSRKAIEILRDKYGYENLMNLTGGIEAWK